MGNAASHSQLSPRWKRQPWMDAAACQGRTHLFFPPVAERPQARARREGKARRVCETCPVMSECRWHARVHREYGYWGGENEEERSAAGFSVPSPVGGRSRRRPLLGEPA